MKQWFKEAQKGFTLVELMVVMGILAVLSSIVFTAVSGTSEVAGNSQVKQDASTINTAITDYYADRTGAEIFTTNTTTILSANTTTKDVAQKISSRWPENYLAETYLAEFPLSAATDGQAVSGTLSFTDSNGTTITAEALAESRNALDLNALAAASYIPTVPKSSTDKSGNFHNYLWLVKKTSSAAESGTVESRSVEVFKLSKVEQNETTKNYTLYYEQIY